MSRETDLAWVAGIIDGEGTMGLYPRSTGWSYRLGVTNTDLRLLVRLREVLEVGGVHTLRPFPVARWRQAYVWYVNGTAAAKVLRQLLPYLVSKQDQATLMLEAKSYIHRRAPQHPLPQSDRERLMEIVHLLKLLKRPKADVVHAPSDKKRSAQLTLLPGLKGA